MVICNEFRGSTNMPTCSFVIDTVDELDLLPTTTKHASGSFSKFDHLAPIGSTCICGNHGSMKIYMLFTDGWQEV